MTNGKEENQEDQGYTERADCDTQQAHTGENGPNKSDARTFFGSASDQPVHNFDGDARNRWRLTALATGADCLKAKDIPADGVDIRYVYCHKIELEEKGGELTEAIRTVFITTEGKCYAAVSAGIAQDANGLFQAFGRTPFEPPVKIRVQEIRTRKGFTTLSVVPV